MRAVYVSFMDHIALEAETRCVLLLLLLLLLLQFCSHPRRRRLLAW